jgi:hypothetical protein
VLGLEEAEVVEVEAEMKNRHPDDGDAAQRVEPVEAGRRCVRRRNRVDGDAAHSFAGGESNGTPESAPSRPTFE